MKLKSEMIKKIRHQYTKDKELQPTIVVLDIEDVQKYQVIEKMKQLTNEEPTKIDVVEKNNESKIFVRLKPEQFQKLSKSGRLHIGWRSLRFYEHIPVIQYYKYLGFGQMAAKCLAKEEKTNVTEKCKKDKNCIK